ncbi:hypothetical protein CK203_019450 [Vitis vinifera]|uniref:Uncharacterized protein n=1 Tax=Vitis vinifera TaxID=29760 RepID=A0A438IZ73_VITVI|nr:hypothetical protein CK203_019450 [Vitis vinifera]
MGGSLSYEEIPGVPQLDRSIQQGYSKKVASPNLGHFPILLEGGGLRRGPYPFKFENMWLKAEGFKEL